MPPPAAKSKEEPAGPASPGTVSAASAALLLGAISAYFHKRSAQAQAARRELTDIIDGSDPISLRLIDWFITHYARAKNVIYWNLDGRIFEDTAAIAAAPQAAQNRIRKVHLYFEYRAQLKAYSKLFFDPFRRHDRITFVLESQPLKVIETTIGQLNFFRWMFQTGAIEYIRRHLGEIEKDMAASQKKETAAVAATRARAIVPKNIGCNMINLSTATAPSLRLRFD